jgi:hypothetical protein
MPYFAFRELSRLEETAEKLLTGKSSRRWIDLSFLQMDSQDQDEQPKPVIFDAQVTVTVCGADHSRWVGYSFVDEYFGSGDDMEEAIDANVQEQDESKFYMYFGDDLTLLTGTTETNESLWDPREYFARLCSIRMALVRNEWQNLVRKFECNIIGYV